MSFFFSFKDSFHPFALDHYTWRHVFTVKFDTNKSKHLQNWDNFIGIYTVLSRAISGCDWQSSRS